MDLPYEECFADVFIDDIISLCLDTSNNCEKICAGPCTVIEALERKGGTSCSVQKDDLIADDKNEAEGGPAEEKICLGLSLNTRSLLVSLPFHKFKAWNQEIDRILAKKIASPEELESLLGRLENIALIISMFGHFLNNIRTLQIRASREDTAMNINQRVEEDLKLAKKFLKASFKGVNMNLMTFRSPDKFYITDASEHGIGGFSSEGRGWSLLIPENLRGRAHINLLEFIGSLIAVWLDIIENRIKSLTVFYVWAIVLPLWDG